jgi:hypothetical protein
MKCLTRLVLVVVLISASACDRGGSSVARSKPLRLQLNWFHDPTFAGEYRAVAENDSALVLIEGGVNVNPIQRLRAGLADAAVVGIDIALKAIESDLKSGEASDIRLIFIDFQRNPVGWVLHPRVARTLGLARPNDVTGRQRNDWLFARFRDRTIRPGDKRGTETSAVWDSWRKKRQLKGVFVLPVGFDASIVLDAPRLAFPVYLNEEPFKLAERIGEPLIVFDPADDGVALYGNVVITTAAVLQRDGRRINGFASRLGSAWLWVQDHPDSAAMLVRGYYKDVSDSVLIAQIKKTTEFVFFETTTPGKVDLAKTGRLDLTIRALQNAATLEPNVVSLSSVQLLIVAPLPEQK